MEIVKLKQPTPLWAQYTGHRNYFKIGRGLYHLDQFQDHIVTMLYLFLKE